MCWKHERFKSPLKFNTLKSIKSSANCWNGNVPREHITLAILSMLLSNCETPAETNCAHSSLSWNSAKYINTSYVLLIFDILECQGMQSSVSAYRTVMVVAAPLRCLSMFISFLRKSRDNKKENNIRTNSCAHYLIWTRRNLLLIITMLISKSRGKKIITPHTQKKEHKNQKQRTKTNLFKVNL